MATRRAFLVAASAVATAMAAATPAVAQNNSTAPAPRVPVLNPTVALRATVTLRDAQRLVEEGRYHDAARAFRDLIADQAAVGEYARDAMRGLAQAEFALGNTRATALALDDLAAAAKTFGDPETQLTSLFNAALLYQEAGDGEQVSSHLPQIRSLLQSPAIPEAVRADIGARVPRR
jgi:hypothetical protein